MRVISSSVRAALIIAALFWGNCLTCPQALKAEAHRCCHKTTRDSANCQTQVLRQFVKADQNSQQAEAPAITVAEAMTIYTAPATPNEDSQVTDPAEHAPPDLYSLHSSYRI